MFSKKPLTEAELFEAIENLSDIETFSDDDEIYEGDLEGLIEEAENAKMSGVLENNGDMEEEENNEVIDNGELEVGENASEYSANVPAAARKSKAYIQQFCEANDLTYKEDIGWRKNVTYITPPLPWYQPSHSQLTNIESPMEYFSKYFTNDLCNTMVDMTNLFAVQNNVHNFSPTNVLELKTLLGIHIMMGNLHYPRTRFYWDSKLGLPIIRDNMKLNRFYKLRQNLHFVNNLERDNNNKDRFWKVRPLYDTIKSRCNELNLESNLGIDEQMVPFKGKLNVKQYVRGKPCPWGVKIFALCGKSGLLYDFMIYQGATTELHEEHSIVFGLGAATVMKLCERISIPYVKLYFDNYFSNYNLLQWLRKKHIYAASTARLDRFQKPPFSSDTVMKKQHRGISEELLSLDGEVILTKWYDNKAVTMSSNFVSVGESDMCRRWDKVTKKYVHISRPEVIRLYNDSMGGVDKLDFLISIYRTFIKSRKWTLRMFTHALDMACVNSWLEYKENCTRIGVRNKDIMDLISFRMYIAEACIYARQGTKRRVGRPSNDNGPLTPPPIKKVHNETRPIDAIRFDEVGHLPVFDESRDGARCKNGTCLKKPISVVQNAEFIYVSLVIVIVIKITTLNKS